MADGKKGALVHQLVHQPVHQKSWRATEHLIMETGNFQEGHVHCAEELTSLMKELSPLLGLTGRKKVLCIV